MCRTHTIRSIVGRAAAVPLLVAPAARSAPPPPGGAGDWLIDARGATATVRSDDREIVLENGLIRRVIRIAPNAATIAYDNVMTGQAELRSVRPEARVTLDGREYDVGGLVGQPIHNYLLPSWLDTMTADPGAFRFIGGRTGPTRERFPWTPRPEWLSAPVAWPPPGRAVEMDFAAPPGSSHPDVRITVCYEIYDALPVLSKWVVITNAGAKPVRVDRVVSEILAWIEPASRVEGKAGSFEAYPRSIHVESDYAFGGSMDGGVAGPAVEWKPDPLYATQVHYERLTPCLLECGPKIGPGVPLAPGESFESPRTFELLHDSTDRERRGLAQRRMYRAMAPWVQENPLIFHAASAEPGAVRAAVDQAAEVGFEMVIMTFGSGFNIETRDRAALESLRGLRAYAASKRIALGGYSLLASRSIDAETDVVNPATGKPGGFAMFGNSPCLGSRWGLEYFATLRAGFEATGLDVLEHDGNYPGDVCASTTHPGHAGLADSQWTQWATIRDFYRWCRGRGIYLNVPDWYYLAGSSKCGMGYRETNWSLPREQQEIIERQNIYDGTWTRTPSMGWMFVPLMEYHGGGPAATIEPLDEHRDHYRTRLDNLLGAGVQACFRGPRLFDTPATRDLVAGRVAWFKANRAILESDIIHGRRPDGRDIDWILHVNPALEAPAMLIVHNPLPTPVDRTLTIDLYYSGMTAQTTMSREHGPPIALQLDARGRAEVPVRVPASGMSWYRFERSW